LHPEEMYYVRQIVRKTEEEINAVRRELQHQEKSGLLKSEKRGNRLYYSLRKDYPLYFQLLEIINKTAGLGGMILKNKRKLGKLKFAVLSGKFIRRLPHKKNEIDLLLIGDILLPKLEKLISKAEEEREKEINYTIMNQDEFNFRKKRNDPFVKNILEGGRVMIVGDELELVQ